MKVFPNTFGTLSPTLPFTLSKPRLFIPTDFRCCESEIQDLSRTFVVAFVETDANPRKVSIKASTEF